MNSKSLGRLGTTSAIGLGLMAMSDAYGPSDRAESIATIHAALDAGITLVDTGDFYGMGHNELLLAEALRGRDRDGVQISAFLGFDGRPVAVKTSLAYSLQRLGTDRIHVYRPVVSAPTSDTPTWRMKPASTISANPAGSCRAPRQGRDVVPVVGARTRQRLDEALGADEVRLTDQQLAAIESAVPKGSAAGDRYDAHQMALLDSER
jgi:aryl-alcohol dehydrogenase-like predicted oxidoreductase